MNVKFSFNKKNALIYSLIIALGIILDQLTKYLTVTLLKPVGSVPIIKGVIHLTYVENRGAAFGMLSDNRWVFLIISTVAILALAVYLFCFRVPNLLYGVSIAMIISGGIGNMIDRLALGYVVDMIDFALINFAVFNGADSFVCVGAGLLILALVLDMIKEAKTKKEEAPLFVSPSDMDASLSVLCPLLSEAINRLYAPIDPFSPTFQRK